MENMENMENITSRCTTLKDLPNSVTARRSHSHAGEWASSPGTMRNMGGSYHTPYRPYPLGIFLKYSAIVERFFGKVFWYVAHVRNNFQQFCFQKYSGNMSTFCWKIFQVYAEGI